MKPRPSLLQKIWHKLRRAKSMDKRQAPVRKVGSSLEALEGRIAPAVLINPTTLMFKDLDGDIVTVKFTKAILPAGLSSTAATTEANDIFKFSTGANAVTVAPTFNAATAPAEQLQLIDLTKVNLAASTATVTGKSLAYQTGITVSAVKTGTGNGNVDVGYINATGIPLGAVTIGGDLGQIDAGLAGVATGLTSLKTKSLGVRDTQDTQGATGTTLKTSNIVGALGSLTVTGNAPGLSNVDGASVIVTSATGSVGKIGAVTISGSLIGRSVQETASDSTGLISAAGDIGAIKIGTTLTDGIKGGGGINAGSIQAGGNIASLTVSGVITGSTGTGSGSVHANGTIGPVIVKSNLSGGAGQTSGSISAAVLGSVTVSGNLTAGNGTDTGLISSTHAIGAVTIGGKIDGTTGGGAHSAGIAAATKIASVKVAGDLLGGTTGTQDSSGFINAGSDIGVISVKSITGGKGKASGTISAGGKIAGVTVIGDVTGGIGISSGSIFSGTDFSGTNTGLLGDMGAVKIGGKLIGNTGDNSGLVSSGGKITSVTIGPAVAVPGAVVMKGDIGVFSGSVVSHGAIGAVKITGNVEGGVGNNSASIRSLDLINSAIESAGDIAAVTIVGHLRGGSGANSGSVQADGNLTSIILGDSTEGLFGSAAGLRSGTVRAGQGQIHPGTIGSVTVKGSLTGTDTAFSGQIVSEGHITNVLITGAANGGAIRSGEAIGTITFNSTVNGTGISAVGQAIQGATTDLAIGKVAFNGAGASATGVNIRAGYNTDVAAVNADAQIGSVVVKGDWVAGKIMAGTTPGTGTASDAAINGSDNVKIISQIASIVIGGNVVGTGATTDHFGFTAQKVTAVTIHGVAKALHATGALDVIELTAGTTDDFTIREVAIPV